MDFLGYLPYLAFIFFPGIFIGEFLGLFQNRETLTERVALAFGLGLAADTLVLSVVTSGASVPGHSLLGMDSDVVYAILGVGLALSTVVVAIKKKFTFYVRPQKIDLAILLIMVGLGAMLAAFFSKYPIFPEYESADFGNHLNFSTGLISGAFSSVPGGILYYGVEYQLAASILLVGGPALVTIRDTMSLLVFLSPLLVYLASVHLFSNRVSALLVTIVYAFSGTLWFDTVFNAGLYANFFGLLASLFLITAFIEVASNLRSKSYWAFFLLVVFMAYFSHYSTLTVLPALLLAALLQYAFHRKEGVEGRKYILPAIIPLIPVALVAAAYPSLIQTVLNKAIGGGGSVTGSTTLSGLLSSVPVLQYMAVEVYDDVAFVVLILLAAVYAYRSGVARNGLLFLPVFWFLAVVLTSPENINGWRFAFMAILPLILMAGQGISYLLPRDVMVASTRRRSGRTIGRNNKWWTGFLVIVFLGLLVVGSWGTSMLSDSFTYTQSSAQSQNEVYESITWLGNHTAPGSRFLSVSDWRFTYTNLMIGRTSVYQFESTPQEALPVAKASNATYIIVTNAVTVNLPAEPSLFPWNNFKPSANLTMVYNNPDVEVFEIT